MRKFFAALFIATLAFTATAQEAKPAERSALLPTTIGLHIGSKHSAPGFNDANPGIYARWADANGSGFALGTYYNSERAQSVWAGYSFSRRMNTLPISAAITVGAVSGYKAAKITPLIVPSVAVHYGSSAARLTFIPKVEKAGAAALHLSLEYSF